MLKNIAGTWFEGKPARDEFEFRVSRLGNGHAEAVVTRPTIWEEVDPALAFQCGERWERMLELEREESVEFRRLANLKRAARRAKTRVRRMVKVLGLDALLTLTYRENQQDLTLCKKHMKEFVRRIRRVIPGFVYVAAFETQKRGAWHVHMAIHRLPASLASVNGVKVKSYNIVRAIWRSVVGDLGGNIDEQRKKKFSKQSTAKLAAYLSKYMLKAFEDGDDWSNRYSASAGVEVPRAVMLRFKAASMAQLIELAYFEIGMGSCECSTWLSRFGDTFFLSTERVAVGASCPS